MMVAMMAAWTVVSMVVMMVHTKAEKWAGK